MRITWEPKAAGKGVASAPASWSVKSQMRMFETAPLVVSLRRAASAEVVDPRGVVVQDRAEGRFR
jgi:hypothetical protein